MERYANLNGDSSVYAYQIGSTSIWVKFDSGKVYEYSYASAGSGNVETMKSLARSGRGLCSFIQRKVKYKYVR